MKIQRKFFKIHSAIFLGLGFIAFMSLYETTPIQMLESKITGRDPASVSSSASLKSTQVLNVDCSEFEQEIQVPAHQVRLEGYLCDKTPEDAKISIRNETTGKTATLFSQGKFKYMTDFIQLASGKNKIVLSYVSKNQLVKEVGLTLVQ